MTLQQQGFRGLYRGVLSRERPGLTHPLNILPPTKLVPSGEGTLLGGLFLSLCLPHLFP